MLTSRITPKISDEAGGEHGVEPADQHALQDDVDPVDMGGARLSDSDGLACPGIHVLRRREGVDAPVVAMWHVHDSLCELDGCPCARG